MKKLLFAAALVCSALVFSGKGAIAADCTRESDYQISRPSRDSVLCFEPHSQEFYMNVHNGNIIEFQVVMMVPRPGLTAVIVSQYKGPGNVGQYYMSSENGVYTSGGDPLVHLASMPWVDLFFYAIQQPIR